MNTNLPWPVDVLGDLETGSLVHDNSDPLFSGVSSGTTSAMLSPTSDVSSNQFNFLPSSMSMEITAALQNAAARNAFMMKDGQNAAECSAIEELKKRKLELQSAESKRSCSRFSEDSLEDLREKNEARLMRNRMSAKQSRERKKMFVATLEQQVNQLLQTKMRLEQIVQQLTWENERLRKDPVSVPPSTSTNSAFLQAQMALGQ